MTQAEAPSKDELKKALKRYLAAAEHANRPNANANEAENARRVMAGMEAKYPGLREAADRLRAAEETRRRMEEAAQQQRQRRPPGAGPLGGMGAAIDLRALFAELQREMEQAKAAAKGATGVGGMFDRAVAGAFDRLFQWAGEQFEDLLRAPPGALEDEMPRNNDNRSRREARGERHDRERESARSSRDRRRQQGRGRDRRDRDRDDNAGTRPGSREELEAALNGTVDLDGGLARDDAQGDYYVVNLAIPVEVWEMMKDDPRRAGGCFLDWLIDAVEDLGDYEEEDDEDSEW